MATYSFMDTVCAITGVGGAVNLGTGAAVADEGITFERAEEKNTMVVGCDNKVMHSLHAGNHGMLSVRLLKTSPTNALLSAMYNQQISSGANWGKNTITLSNPATGDITTFGDCAFKKHPNLAYGKEGGIVEWQFDAGSIDTLLGPG